MESSTDTHIKMTFIALAAAFFYYKCFNMSHVLCNQIIFFCCAHLIPVFKWKEWPINTISIYLFIQFPYNFFFKMSILRMALFLSAFLYISQMSHQVPCGIRGWQHSIRNFFTAPITFSSYIILLFKISPFLPSNQDVNMKADLVCFMTVWVFQGQNSTCFWQNSWAELIP